MLLTSATDEQQTQKRWEILCCLCVRSTGEGEAALLPEESWAPARGAALGPPGTSAWRGMSQLPAFGTADSGSASLIETSGLNPAQAPAWEKSSSRQDPERSDRAGNLPAD